MLIDFVKSQANKVYCDEVSIEATTERFATWMQELPNITYEQELMAKQMKQKEELMRKKHVEEYYKSLPINDLN